MKLATIGQAIQPVWYDNYVPVRYRTSYFDPYFDSSDLSPFSFFLLVRFEDETSQFNILILHTFV